MIKWLKQLDEVKQFAIKALVKYNKSLELFEEKSRKYLTKPQITTKG